MSCSTQRTDGLETPLQRLYARFELCELAERVMRQNLVRRHPEATPEQSQELMNAWFSKRPEAAHGGGQGRAIARRPSDAPRKSSARPGR